MYKKIIPIIFCIAVIITQVSCVSKETVSKTDFYLNTTCTIEIQGMSKSEAEQIIDLAFKECARYEKLFSRTLDGSDIYSINNSKGQPIEVSPETIEVIDAGINQSKETYGTFDITMGKLTALWDFSSNNPKVPSQEDITSALSTVGYEKIKIEKNTVYLTDPNTWLDLGAVAKGYIADKLVVFLKEHGVNSGIINLGGNIATIGTKDNGSPWRIGIETPYSNKNEILGALDLKNQTVVTSGIYERYFEENNVKYHHVLSSKDGYPISTDIVSVSILSSTGNSIMCDLYSTTCLLLGKEKSIEFMADKENFEYCIVDTDGNVIVSDDFNLSE